MPDGDPWTARSPQSGNNDLPDFDGGQPASGPQHGPATPPPYGQQSLGQPSYGQQPASGQHPAHGQQPAGQPAPYGQVPGPQAYGQQPPPYGSQPQYQYGGEPPQKQGMSTGAKVGLGCGIAVVVALVLMLAGCFAIITSEPDSSSDGLSSGIAAEEEAADDPSSPAAAPAAPAPAVTADPSAAPAPAADPVPQVEERAEAVAGLGEKVSLPPFDVQVAGLETGVTELDNMFADPPNGEYIVVTVSVTNTGSTQEMISEDEFVLIDDAGNLHSASDSYALDDGISYEDVNPGVTIDGRIVFDAPAGTVVDYVAYEPEWGSEYILVKTA